MSRTSKDLKEDGIAVNSIYDGIGSSTSFTEDEVYLARLFYPDGRMFTFPTFSESTITSSELKSGLAHTPDPESLVRPNEGRDSGNGEHEILVCTHGSRDCRCSDRGLPLVHALRKEIERRGVGGRVRVRQVGHVGGHKWVLDVLTLDYSETRQEGQEGAGAR